MKTTELKRGVSLISTKYKKVREICIQEMKSNKGKKLKQFVPLALADLERALNAGVTEDVAILFRHDSTVLTVLAKNPNLFITGKEPVLSKIQDCNEEIEKANVIHWISLNVEVDEEFMYDILKYCHWRDDYINENIKTLTEKDTDELKSILYPYIGNASQRQEFSFVRDITDFVATYLKFKQFRLQPSLITPLVGNINEKYIDMYIHVARNFQDKFTEITKLLLENESEYDFHSAALAVIYPKLFSGANSLQKKNNAHILAIIEIHHVRTGKVLSMEEVNSLCELSRHDFIRIDDRLTKTDYLLGNFILTGASIIVYKNMNLKESELVAVLEGGCDFTKIYAECRKYTLISLKSTELSSFRKELLRNHVSKEKAV